MTYNLSPRYGVHGDVAISDREKPSAGRPDARALLERHAGRRSAGALPIHEASIWAVERPIGAGYSRLYGHLVPDATDLWVLLGYARPALVRAGELDLGRVLRGVI